METSIWSCNELWILNFPLISAVFCYLCMPLWTILWFFLRWEYPVMHTNYPAVNVYKKTCNPPCGSCSLETMGFSHVFFHSFLQGTLKKTSKSYGFLIPKMGFLWVSNPVRWWSMVPGILGPKNATKRSWMALGMPRDLVNALRSRSSKDLFSLCFVKVYDKT